MNELRPRYLAIEDWLVEQCKVLPPGTLLPSEPELAAKFAVSRMTARQAVQGLAAAGLVERRRGSGTFVAAPILHRREGVLLSFTEDMRNRGMKSSSRLISGKVVASPEDALALGLKPTASVVQIVRVRYSDDIPLALERVSLPGGMRGILEKDLESGSLHGALGEMGYHISHAYGFVRARLATESEARILGLTTPAPLLMESRTVYDNADKPLERTETSYVASRWVLDTGTYAVNETEVSR